MSRSSKVINNDVWNKDFPGGGPQKMNYRTRTPREDYSTSDAPEGGLTERSAFKMDTNNSS